MKRSLLLILLFPMLCFSQVGQTMKKSKSALALERLKLVSIAGLDSSICLDLKYATTDNFTGKILYPDQDMGYLQPKVAQMLVNAQRYLKSSHPNLSLIVYDAVRPLSVQKKMFEEVQNTPFEAYVANPTKTGLHNYGVAVDLSICNSKTGIALKMGTPFDSFEKKAGIREEEKWVKEGILTREEVNNRVLLRQVMQKAGFSPILGEWWHFNAFSLEVAKKQYSVIVDLR